MTAGGLPRVRRVPVFWIGFLVVLVARALVAASRLDDYRGEEFYQGSFAWALLKGFPLDPARLPVIAHLRGSVVFAGLAVPFYALFGPSYVALKAVAVLWSALAGGLIAFVVERGLGPAFAPCARRRSALVAVALAAVFPPAYQMVDTCAYGSHMDSVVPTLLALAAVFAHPGPLSFRRASLLGLALGFGAFFSLQCVVAAPAVLAAWWASDRGFWRRRASLGVLCAALPAAFIPVISRSNKLVMKGMGDHLLPDGLAGAGAKLAAWFGGDGVRVTLFEVSGGAWAGWVFALGVVVAAVLLVPRLARLEALAFFAFLHPLLVFAAWVLSDFELNFVVTGGGMGSRYLTPTMPAIAIALVLGAAALRARGAAGVLGGRALIGTVLATGALGFAGLLDSRPLLDLPPRLGTNFALFETHFRNVGDWRARLALARKVDPDWDAYRPLEYRFLAPPDEALAPGNGPPTEKALRAALGLPADERPYALAAMGGAGVGSPASAHAAAALAALPPDFPPDDARWYARGIGRAVMTEALPRAIVDLRSRRANFFALGRLTGDYAEDVLLGAGFQLGRLFVPYNQNTQLMLDGTDQLPPRLRESLLRGVALGWRLRFREATWRVPKPGAAKIERLLAPEDRAAFRAGLALPLDAWGDGR